MIIKKFVSAIIVAGGKGSRISILDCPKQFFLLDEHTVLYHSIEKFVRTPCINEVIIVTLPDYIDAVQNELDASTLPHKKKIKITVGGETRQQSVYQGFLMLDSRCDTLAIHDAARPFVTTEEIERTVEAAIDCATVLGTRVTDTIKYVSPQGFVSQTPDRALLWAVQTPQVLPLHIYQSAYEKATGNQFAATDDVSLAEYLGVPVKVVEGSPNNFKITTNGDLARAKHLIRQTESRDKRAKYY